MITVGEFRVKNGFELVVSEGVKAVFETGEIVMVTQCKKEQGLCVSQGNDVIDIPYSLHETLLANLTLVKRLDEDCDCDCEDPDCDCEDCYEYVDDDTGEIIDPEDLDDYEITSDDEDELEESLRRRRRERFAKGVFEKDNDDEDEKDNDDEDEKDNDDEDEKDNDDEDEKDEFRESLTKTKNVKELVKKILEQKHRSVIDIITE